MSREVVLVHGLWMPAGAMVFLSAFLARRGFRVRRFAYRGRSRIEGNAERLAAFARDAGHPLHYVGHSLGGVLILEMAKRHPHVPIASAVMVGSPVRGCSIGRRLGLAGIGRWMMGASRELWEAREAAWTRTAPLGVIAGTLPLGLGLVLGRLPEPNDGVVCVSETEVAGMSARALVPAGHSGLIFSPRVAALIARFLSSGRFE